MLLFCLFIALSLFTALSRVQFVAVFFMLASYCLHVSILFLLYCCCGATNL